MDATTARLGGTLSGRKGGSEGTQKSDKKAVGSHDAVVKG
jgi:hypothetical protein